MFTQLSIFNLWKFCISLEYWLNYFSSQKSGFGSFLSIIESQKIKPVFYTSTKLSERAAGMAKALGVLVEENKSIGEFPRIKCNINTDEFGRETKIYHLPMGQ